MLYDHPTLEREQFKEIIHDVHVRDECMQTLYAEEFFYSNS